MAVKSTESITGARSSLGGYVFMKKTSSPPWTPGTDFGESVIAYEVIQTGVIKK